MIFFFPMLVTGSLFFWRLLIRCKQTISKVQDVFLVMEYIKNLFHFHLFSKIVQFIFRTIHMLKYLFSVNIWLHFKRLCSINI